MTSPRHGSRDKMILQTILLYNHYMMTHCPIFKLLSTDLKVKILSSEGATVNPTNTTPNEGVNINPNDEVVDTTNEEEKVSAENPEVTWDSVIDEFIPDTSKVSKGVDTLGMPRIINLQRLLG